MHSFHHNFLFIVVRSIRKKWRFRARERRSKRAQSYIFARLNKTRLDDWTRATSLYARNGSGEPNDLINFPTGLDSAGLPAGDFVPESPWRTARSKKVGPATTETSVLPIICEMSVVVHTRLRERAATRVNHDFTFSRFILLAGNTQSSVTLASPGSASKCRS